MNYGTLKEWVLFTITVLSLVVTWAVTWTKLTSKVNGMGGRVKKVEDSCTATGGQMGRMERELADYRRDAQDAIGRMGRVEKGLEDLKDSMQQGNLSIGVQLHNIALLINDKDSRLKERVIRIETLTQIEAKLGPIPLN